MRSPLRSPWPRARPVAGKASTAAKAQATRSRVRTVRWLMHSRHEHAARVTEPVGRSVAAGAVAARARLPRARARRSGTVARVGRRRRDRDRGGVGAVVPADRRRRRRGGGRRLILARALLAAPLARVLLGRPVVARRTAAGGSLARRFAGPRAGAAPVRLAGVAGVLRARGAGLGLSGPRALVGAPRVRPARAGAARARAVRLRAAVAVAGMAARRASGRGSVRDHGAALIARLVVGGGHRADEHDGAAGGGLAMGLVRGGLGLRGRRLVVAAQGGAAGHDRAGGERRDARL